MSWRTQGPYMKAWRRNHILHEFGHMLGLLHEHLHSAAYQLAEPAVKQHYASLLAAAAGQTAADGAAYAEAAVLSKYM